MASIKSNKSNNIYNFICRGYSNRNGFVHECNLFINDKKVTTSKCQYYNRTWESFRFQSVMSNAIYNLISEETENLKDGFKELMGYKNLTKKRLIEFEAYCRINGERLEELKEIKERVNYSNGYTF